MAVQTHDTHVYVGLADEGMNIGQGGLYSHVDGDEEWHSLTQGLPANPQARVVVVHPGNSAIVYAGTHFGPYRSDAYGAHWEALEAPRDGMDCWFLGFHSA